MFQCVKNVFFGYEHIWDLKVILKKYVYIYIYIQPFKG